MRGWDTAVNNHEISHFFHVTSSGANEDRPPKSLEDHIDFSWLAPSEFDKQNLQPAPLRKLITNLKSQPQSIWYASTIDPSEG